MLTAIHNRPLLNFSLAFASGIALSLYGINPAVALGLLVAGLAVLAFSRRQALVVIVALVTCGVGCGALRYASSVAVPATDISRFADGRIVTIDGTVASDPQSLPERTTFIVHANRVSVGNAAAGIDGNVFVTELLPRGAHAKPLDYGDRVQAQGILELPRPPGNPGAFSWRDYLSHRGIYCQLLVRRPQSLRKLGSGPFSLLSMAVAVRDHVVHAVQKSVKEPEASVLLGVLIGRRSELPAELGADFTHTGTVHILASAGLHVGILAGCLLLLARALTLPRKLSLLLLIGVLATYAVICGGRPSVTRAVIMAVVFFAGIILEREPDTPTTLGAAGFIILGWQPTALFEAGFQLSFLTVSTLAICMPVWDALMHRCLPYSRHPAHRAAVWALDIMGVSIFAQIGSAPIVAESFNEISLIGIPSNLLVVPLLFLLIPIAMIALAAGIVWPAAGSAMLTLCAKMAILIIIIVRFCGEADWSYQAIPSPPFLAIVAYYTVVFTTAAYVRRRLARSSKTGADVEGDDDSDAA